MSRILCPLLLLFLLAVMPGTAKPGGWTVIAWNDLGMHCMDGDYTVFSILPPYNTIHAQVIDPSGKLVRSGGAVTVTYEAIADAQSSRNTTSTWKTNFWTFAKPLFGASLAGNTGLTGNAMPGPSNTPQPMKFEAAWNWYTADGIPLTPYDDQGNKNPYPLMRISVRDASGVLASTDIVLPVSDEMSCRSCHASGSGPAARPSAGWANAQPFERDYKLNILRLHDDRETGSPAYASALAAAGYKAAGLSATAAAGTPILCAACHGSNALAAAGQPGVASLTRSIHSFHATVADPTTGVTLNSAQNRDACYACHPGAATRCLRGVMGNSVASDGSRAIQCQSCHGSMSVVGAPRQGWLEEPNCQACHTGAAPTATSQVRWTSVFDAAGAVRQAATTLFATTPNVPAAGLSLYRFSTGHGGLACEACHGSTHAIVASSHANDNVQNIAMQGHSGTLSECSACHASVSTTNGGPHTLHPVGQSWVQGHERAAGGSGRTACAGCHGADFRGTVLSRALMQRTLSIEGGTRQLFAGAIVGCYMCHNGPGGNGTAPAPATVANVSASARTGGSVSIQLNAGGGTLRIVSQPAHGTVALNGTNATYFADPDFEGADTFTFASFNGGRDSNLGVGTVTVTADQRPSVNAAGVVNAAGFRAGPIAPGELVTVYGQAMGPKTLASYDLNGASLFSRLLAGTRVLFDGAAAPIVYSSATQLTAIVPYSVAGKASASMAIEYNGIRSTAVSLNVAASAPGLFTLAGGTGQAAAINQDGVTFNDAAHPAATGSVVSLYVTGEGAADVAIIDGQIAPGPAWKPVAAVTATVGGFPATVLYAGGAPGNVAGVTQVNVQIPAATAAGGAVPVQLRIAGATTQDGVTIAVR